MTFTQRQLYGGAIIADVPANFIDASDIRQIPDHQEVFLSQETLTSVIFEINEYQTTTAVDLHSNIQTSNSASQDADTDKDKAASTYHFLDPVIDPDTVDLGLSQPSRVTMAKNSVSQFPAYIQTGIIISPEVDRGAKSVLPADWHATPPTMTTRTKVYQLLVRMEQYTTDFVVRVNVPLKELDESRQNAESTLAEQIVQHVISSFDVKSFELFGSD